MTGNKYILPLYCIALALLPAVACAQGLIIPSGSYVIQSGGNFIMGEKFKNNGSFTQNNGTLVFNGTSVALEGNATSFKNIRVAGGTATIGTSGHVVRDVLRSYGTLNVGGNLTLLSTSSQTALVDGAGTGDILGNLNMQRYLPSAFGYKYFSSPFQSATVNEFSDEVNLSAVYPPVHKYDESFTSTGWMHYSNSSNPLVPMRGYAVNFGTSGAPVTADMTGVVNNGSQSLTLYNHNYTYTQGFNLVGNPYPSPIDWNAASGWTRTNIDNAIYYFDADNGDEYDGTYSSYINGISSDGIANNIIPAMQAFFVHVSNGSYPVTGTFGMNNLVRVNNFNPVFHKDPGPQNPMLRLSVKNTNTDAGDPAVIYFDDNATLAFEGSLDALKMLNTDPRVPNAYVLSSDGTKLSISAMPAPGDSISQVPLGVETSKDGIITFQASDIERMPYGINIYLADAQMRKIHDLQAKTPYITQLAAGQYTNRFSVIFSKRPLNDGLFAFNGLNAYSADGKIFIYLNLITGDQGELMLTNIAGQVLIRSGLNGFGYHEVPASYTTGIYILSFHSREGVFSKKLFIGHP